MVTRRIASLLAGGTEILYRLGLGDQVVAISHECDFPPEVCTKPRVTHANIDPDRASGDIDTQVRGFSQAGQSLYRIDVEKLVGLQPDVIVTQSQCEVCAVSLDDVRRAVESHPKLRNAKVVALNPTTLDVIFEDILRVGYALDCSDRAESLVGQLRRRVDAVRDRTVNLPPTDRPRLACIEWIEPLMVAANWMPQLVEIAGGRHDLTTTGSRSAYTKWDNVLEYDPEVIVIMPCGFDLARARREAPVLTRLSGWRDLRAVRTERVYAVDGNAYFNRSGPRMIDSLEILTALIHPDLFPEHAKLRAANSASILS